ncbi:hypothetical protein ACQP2E_10115 [Actinoplanes sp. CA-015351]|uniref:hypothetical protein n=1 Tax=Actinoplanes sp. CA-015351 TaxID=3239897 RepID=UPI003D97F442
MLASAADVRHVGHRMWRRVARWGAVAWVAVVCAGALASAGAWVGWRNAGPLPSDQQATEIVGEVLPGAVIGEIERWDVTFGDQMPAWVTRLISDDEYDGGSVLVSVPVPDVAAVRETLARTGWRILPNSGVERISDGQTVEFVTARRHGVEMAVFHDTRYGGEGIVFQHPEPAPVRELALAGGVAGLLLGGSAALMFTAGHVGLRPWNKSAWAGGVLLALPTAAVVSELLHPAAAIPPDVPGAPWDGYVYFKLLIVLGLISWGRACVLRHRHRRR